MKEAIVKTATEFLEKAKENAPTYMSWGAVLGLGVTVFFAVKAAPKVSKHFKEGKTKIEEIIAEKGKEDGKEEIRKVQIDTAKNMGMDALPAMVSGVVTATLILKADEVHNDRTASALVYAEVADRARKRYEESTKEVVGKKKEEEIRERAATKLVAETYSDNVPIYNTGKGNVIYLEEWDTTYFRSSRSAIDAAVNKINQRFQYRDEYYIPLNDFKHELGIPETKFGKDNGFAAEDGPLEVYYTVAVMPDGNHCIAVRFDLSKKYQDTYKVPR